MSKFWRRGFSVVKFAPVVTTLSAPLRTEITAGTPLLGITNMSGFSLKNTPIKVPSMDDAYTPQITGEDNTEDSSITFNDDTTPPATRAALAKGTAGYLILMPYGDVPTKRCEVWNVTSTGVNDQWDATGTTPAQFMVGFAINLRPVQNAVIPT